MDELAEICVSTVTAGFVAYTNTEEYEAFLSSSPDARRFIPNQYTICVLSVMKMVSEWMEKNNRSDDLHCWFEAGATHELDAKNFVARLRQSARAMQKFRITAEVWVPKDKQPIFASADLLMWECQRNTRFCPDGWRPRLNVLRRDQTRPLYVQPVNRTSISSWAAHNFFHGLFSGAPSL